VSNSAQKFRSQIEKVTAAIPSQEKVDFEKVFFFLICTVENLPNGELDSKAQTFDFDFASKPFLAKSA
jgi:hypothetical protein